MRKALVLVLTLAALPVLAESAPAGSRMFNRIDANHDGQVSREEFMAARAHRPAERRRLTDAQAVALFDRADANRDGKLSRSEFASLRTR